MDVTEEIGEELRNRLRAELQRRAENRGWTLPVHWSDDVLSAVQYVFDQERIEVARRFAPGIANPFVTLRLTKDQ